MNRGRGVTVRRGEEANPLLTLHREMNRVFNDVFHGFNLVPFGFDRTLAWPNVEVSETDKEVKVTALRRCCNLAVEFEPLLAGSNHDLLAVLDAAGDPSWTFPGRCRRNSRERQIGNPVESDVYRSSIAMMLSMK